MKTLALIPRKRTLEFALIRKRDSLFVGEVPIGTDGLSPEEAIDSILRRLAALELTFDYAVARCVHAGSLLTTPELYTPELRAKLNDLVYQAPIHLPYLLEMADHLCERCPFLKLALISETGFFSSLPNREKYYALPPETAIASRPSRYGYHGIYHRHAAELGRQHGAHNVISICLDPIPELTAIKSGRPLYVTSGATPIEGLPGENCCGEIDPFIVLIISKTMKWGPEQIDDELTNRSGLAGLAGKHLTLAEVISSDGDELRLPRDLFLYRLLLACGSAVVAMGKVDMVTFTGRYATDSTPIANYLKENLRVTGADGITYRIDTTPLDILMADLADPLAHFKGDEYTEVAV